MDVPSDVQPGQDRTASDPSRPNHTSLPRKGSPTEQGKRDGRYIVQSGQRPSAGPRQIVQGSDAINKSLRATTKETSIWIKSRQLPSSIPSIPIDSQLFPNHSTPFPTVSEATFFRSSGQGYRGIPAGVIPKCHVSHTKLWDQIAPRKCSRGVGHLQPVASMWSELHGETCFLVEKEKLKMAILSK